MKSWHDRTYTLHGSVWLLPGGRAVEQAVARVKAKRQKAVAVVLVKGVDGWTPDGSGGNGER